MSAHDPHGGAPQAGSALESEALLSGVLSLGALAGELPLATEELYYRGMAGREKDRPQVELLTFMLADEEYALGIRKVREIIRVPKLTPVPRVVPFLLGIISVRGGIVPVIDLRRRLRLEPIALTPSARILIAVREGEPYGLLVDRVRQVVRMGTAEIEPPPAGLSSIELEFLQGIGRHKDRLLILLDLDPVLSFRAEANRSSAPEAG